jgi:tRNA isopentenyl-2-thiomethyl-A-37 hydroxylase MiaE
MHGLADRDQLVLRETVNRNIPIVTVTAGGYAQHMMDTVKIHAETCKIAAQIYREFSPNNA